VADPFKDDIIQRIIAVLSFEKTRTKIRKWAKQRFKNGIYELDGEIVVRWIGDRVHGRIQISDIEAWQIRYAGPIDIIAIDLRDGTTLSWLDEENDLIQILKSAASDRMLQPIEA
jgi:hypothetical protein